VSDRNGLLDLGDVRRGWIVGDVGHGWVSFGG
jgi:hypothetical protein